jgi:hypothetical protein
VKTGALIVIGCGTLLVVLFGLTLVKLPEAMPRSPVKGESASRVGLVEFPSPQESDGSLTGFLLHDPTPLFLPTELNSGRVDPGMTRERSPGTSFESIPAKHLFAEINIKLAIPEVVAIPASALNVVIDAHESIILTELSRIETPAAALKKRVGRLQVLSIESGLELWATDLVEPSLTTPLEAPWEFILAITTSGAVGSPVVVSGGEGNGIDLLEVARVFKGLNLGARFTPGIYRILLGP